jgi:hypothetical protein
MALGLESLTSELDNKETAFQSLPQSELMKKRQSARTGGLPPSLQDALVAEKVLNDKAAAAREMSLSMQGDPRTVAQQNEAAIVGQTTAEVANAVGQANANKMQRQQKNMQKLASINPRMLQGMQQKRGLAGAPVQRRQVMAEGGIVGYQDGGILDKLKDKRTGLYHPGLHMFDSLGQSVYDYVTKNPLESAGYTLLANPLLRGGSKLLQGLGGTKLGQRGLGALKNLLMTPKPGVPKNLKKPDLNYQMPKVGKRKFKPGVKAGAAGIGALGLNQLLKSDAPVEKKLPDSTYDEVPAMPKIGATPSADAAEREARQQRALDKFIYMSAGKNLKDMSDRSMAFDQQKFANKIEQDTLTAKQELNKINSANVLQNRLTQVNAEIAGLQEQLSNTPTNQALKKADAELQEAIEDGKDTTNLQKRVNLLRISSAAELERYADPMGSGDVGLLVQRKELQARVRELQKSLTNDPMDAIVARNT